MSKAVRSPVPPAFWRRALANDAGVTSIEYALLSSLIAVTIAGICSSLFASLSSEYGEITAIFN
jgi:Flp pilus assembly pilin Flp